MTTQPSSDKNRLFFPHFLRDNWALFSLLVIVVSLLSLMPQEAFPKVKFSKLDVIVHLLMYSSLAYALSLALYSSILGQKMNTLLYPILLSLFGLMIEILQGILPLQRYFSWEDALSNTLGALGFIAFAYQIKR